MNYKYGRFINGVFEYAPKKLIITEIDEEGREIKYEIINPTEEQYETAGYLKIVYTEQPEPKEGYYYTWEIQDIDGIPTQVWIEHEIPEPIPEE